ncbi:hypothetical protein GCM10023084_55010 [Streptomyces lacrimifluminis]|uniref:PBP domain-containing protein n=1 Tax=Streptomyces lacrimifluminis TaxID=1500077 RepID=A0A917KZP9_9ACTN|nr:hypothetical protein GCM10012282_32850 [Streptomyces lacrimifluminis]
MRRVYSGAVGYWDELDPALPHWRVVLVSRDADSGTRQVFQDRVLDGKWEGVPSTSLGCDLQEDPSAPVRCELDSTEDVLKRVAATRGAIGYSELGQAVRRRTVNRVALDGATAGVDAIEYDGSHYPYRGVEYAYTYADLPTGSLAGSFLNYVRNHGQGAIRNNGHIPCTATSGERLCDDFSPGA